MAACCGVEVTELGDSTEPLLYNRLPFTGSFPGSESKEALMGRDWI